MGISPQMPSWMNQFLRQYSIQTSAPHVWVHAPRRSLRTIYSNDIADMNNRIDALLAAVPPHERVEHIDEWEGPRPLRPCFLGCTVSMLHPKTWAPLSIVLSVSNLGHFTIDDMRQKEARTLARCYHASWEAQRAHLQKSNSMMIDNTAVNPSVCRSLGVVAMRCGNHILEIALTRLFFPCNMTVIQQRGAHPRAATKHNLCPEVVVAPERLRACCVALLHVPFEFMVLRSSACQWPAAGYAGLNSIRQRPECMRHTQSRTARVHHPHKFACGYPPSRLGVARFREK